MKSATVLIFASLALAMSASTHVYGCRAWAVLVFLSVTAFMLAVARVHVVANQPKKEK